MGSVRRLLALTRPPWRLVGIGFAASLVVTVTALGLPLAVRDFVDRVQNDRSTWPPLALLVVLVVVQAGFDSLRVQALGRAGERVVAALRTRVFGHLQRLPVSFFDERPVGDLTASITADTQLLQVVASQRMVQLGSGVFTVTGGIVLMMFLDARMSIAIVVVTLLCGVLGHLAGRRMRRASRETQEQLALVSAQAERTLGAVRIVKAFVAEPVEEARLDVHARGAERAAIKAIRLQAWLQPAIFTLIIGGVLVVGVYGGSRVADGSLSTGTLVAFLFTIIYVVGPALGLVQVFVDVQRALGAADRLDDVLATPTEPDTGTTPLPRPLRGELAFDAVTFAYRDGADAGEPVLADLSFTASPGTVTALVGPSGAGKSTVFALVERFYAPGSGAITIDGVETHELRLSELRSAIAYVPQETTLFTGSVRDNIAYGRPGASLADVRAAAVAANADGFVGELPDGYDTRVGERGVKLSGGQRQRLAIARALLVDPRILLLDEATASLDAIAEEAVQEALSRLMAGRTTLVIAHRLATVVAADQILVLDRGRLRAAGPHDDLLEASPLYRRLARRELRAA